MKAKLYKHSVASGLTSDTFRIPMEYAKILGVFLYGTSSQTISLYRDNREVLPLSFDAGIITFTGNLPIEQVMFPLDFANQNETWNISISNSSGLQIYFLVE